MRWLIAADLHLRPETWARLPQLRGDAYESLRQIVAIGISEKVAGIILLGDVFDGTHPDALSVHALATATEQCHRAGLHLYLIQGNHDAVSVRAVDQSPTSWASAVWAMWMHNQTLPLGPHYDAAGNRHTGYFLDYTPPNQLAGALWLIPPECDVLFAHQSWAELQRVGHTDGNVGMLPPHVKYVLTGDNHKRMTVVALGRGGPVTFYSLGNTCMQAVNEDPDKYVAIVDFASPEPRIEPRRLVTRPFVKLSFNTAAEFDAYVANPHSHIVPNDGCAREAVIAAPLVHAKISDQVTDYKLRLRNAITCPAHIDCEPLPAGATEVEIDYEALSLQGGFETLAGAIKTLATQGGSPPELAEDVIALLRTDDRPPVLTTILERFLERRRTCQHT